MRWIVLLAALPLLGACNLVTTTDPLFTAADSAGAPALRDGLWLTEDPKCRVDTRKPVQRWPKCAEWGLVRGGEMLGYTAPEEGEPPEWSGSAFLLAAGDPRILQVADQVAGDDGKSTRLYYYAGLTPTARDGEGRITAYDWWMVQCGPPPKGKGKRPDDQTDAPFPGLTLNTAKSENDIAAGCTTGDPQVLRAAAVASRTLEPPRAGRWIRDTFP